MQKILLLLALLCTFSFAANAQTAGKTAIVKGRIMNAATKEPANDVQLTIPRLKLVTTTNGEGYFDFSQVPYGNYTVIIGGANYRADTVKVNVMSDITDLPVMNATPSERNVSLQSQDQLPSIALEESNLSTDDDGVKAQNVSGLLTASRDPFLNTAAFVFGPQRFQARGYDRNGQQVLINGAVVNDVETGDAYWSQWGGLNDVFRARANTYGLQPSEYTFGGVNGSTYFDATAANQRKQARISYSITDRSYRNRLMLTYSSGMRKDGWAYSLSVSKRWAQEGYIEGTFYDSYSYYAGISKKIGKHLISLTSFGAPTSRGKAGPAIQEAYDLAGTNYYNPNWGYQNGEKRNAKVNKSYQPTTILNYEYKPSNRTRWNTALAYQFGKVSNSSLDYYKGNSPYPDYYRNFPSYQISQPGYTAADGNFLNQKQIDWDRLYNVNYANVETIRNVNGDSNYSVTGKRSVYVQGADVDNIHKYIFNSNLERVMNEHLTLTGGLSVIHQKTESYRELLDLLGGDFYLNLNQFAVLSTTGTTTNSQYDLDNPNRLVKVGDRYNYNYINRFTKGNIFGQLVANYNKFDFFVAVQGGTYSFSREGLYRYGLAPTNSYGLGAEQSFGTYSAKGGVTYKYNGRNYFFVNGQVGSEAPTIENTYISSRTRNYVVSNPVPEQISSLEGGYLMRSPSYNVRAVGYVTDIKDATEIKRFYDDDFSSFVNYVLTGVDTRHLGLELAVEAKLTSTLTATGVAAIGQSFYTSNPDVRVYIDNDTIKAPAENISYLKNYYTGAGPQSAYSLSLNYRSKKYYYITAAASYYDRNYIDVNPDRHTVDAAALIDRSSPLYHQIFDQEKLPSAFTVDIFGGKSFLLSKYYKKIPRSTFLYINVGISNLLDNQDIKTGGFQQLRYNFQDNNPAKFPNKYFYGLGRNFFVNLSLKF